MAKVVIQSLDNLTQEFLDASNRNYDELINRIKDLEQKVKNDRN